MIHRMEEHVQGKWQVALKKFKNLVKNVENLVKNFMCLKILIMKNKITL